MQQQQPQRGAPGISAHTNAHQQHLVSMIDAACLMRHWQSVGGLIAQARALGFSTHHVTSLYAFRLIIESLLRDLGVDVKSHLTTKSSDLSLSECFLMFMSDSEFLRVLWEQFEVAHKITNIGAKQNILIIRNIVIDIFRICLTGYFHLSDTASLTPCFEDQEAQALLLNVVYADVFVRIIATCMRADAPDDLVHTCLHFVDMAGKERLANAIVRMNMYYMIDEKNATVFKGGVPYAESVLSSLRRHGLDLSFENDCLLQYIVNLLRIHEHFPERFGHAHLLELLRFVWKNRDGHEGKLVNERLHFMALRLAMKLRDASTCITLLHEGTTTRLQTGFSEFMFNILVNIARRNNDAFTLRFVQKCIRYTDENDCPIPLIRPGDVGIRVLQRLHTLLSSRGCFDVILNKGGKKDATLEDDDRYRLFDMFLVINDEPLVENITNVDLFSKEEMERMNVMQA